MIGPFAIDVDGEPWIVCQPEDPAEFEDFVRKCGQPARSVATRYATPREAAKLAAEKALKAHRGENPVSLFGIAL
jgi:hypothetical protein